MIVTESYDYKYIVEYPDENEYEPDAYASELEDTFKEYDNSFGDLTLKDCFGNSTDTIFITSERIIFASSKDEYFKSNIWQRHDGNRILIIRDKVGSSSLSIYFDQVNAIYISRLPNFCRRLYIDSYFGDDIITYIMFKENNINYFASIINF